MKKTFIKIFTMFGVFALSLYVFALDLKQLKTEGKVGELPNGYLGAVIDPPSADLKAFIDDINVKRKVSYQDIAKSHNTPLDVVESQSGKKVRDTVVDAEEFYKTELSGKGMKK